jgi:hypothetical protein
MVVLVGIVERTRFSGGFLLIGRELQAQPASLDIRRIRTWGAASGALLSERLQFGRLGLGGVP